MLHFTIHNNSDMLWKLKFTTIGYNRTEYKIIHPELGSAWQSHYLQCQKGTIVQLGQQKC